EDCPQPRSHDSRVVPSRPDPAGHPHRRGAPGIGNEGAQAIGQCVDVSWLYEKSFDAVAHDASDMPDVGHDDRACRGHRLEHGRWHTFAPGWERKYARGLDVCADVASPADDLTRVVDLQISGHRREPCGLPAIVTADESHAD